MSEKTKSDDDLGWGTPPPVATTSHKSSFTEPEMITDVTDRHLDDGFENPVEVETDDNSAQAGATAADEAVAPRGPNYPILAVLAVVGLAAMGGAGWWANKQFFTPKVNPARELMAVRAETAKLPNVPTMPFSTKADGGGGKAEISVFDEPAPASANVPVVVAAASAPAVSPALPSVVAVAPSVGVFVPPSSTYVLTPALAVPVTTTVVPSAAPVTSTKASAAVVPAKQAQLATQLAAPKVVVAAAEPVTKRSVKAATKTSTATRRVVARTKALKRVVAQRRGARVTAKAATSVEEFMLPRGLSVQSIYPMSGPNAQAWLTDSNGKVEIVRVGDSLRSGPQVLSIRGERGEVATSAGLITTRGVTR